MSYTDEEDRRLARAEAALLEKQEDEMAARVAKKLAPQVASAVSDAVAGLKGGGNEAPVSKPRSEKYKVTGPGYSEQFTSRKPALDSYDKLIKRLMKNEQVATVRLLGQEPGSTKWSVEQELKVNEDHY